MTKTCGVCGVEQNVNNSGVRRYNSKNEPKFNAYCKRCESDRAIIYTLKRYNEEKLIQRLIRAKSIVNLIELELSSRVKVDL